ncbi:MAG: glycine betaine ABC transporter substrate-binding protein [Acidobacteriota bacterium]
MRVGSRKWNQAALLAAGFLLAACGCSASERIVVGSKNFTEQVVLGEIVAQHLEARTGLPVERRFYLAGSYICHQSIVAGRLDLYVEYTGTALSAILKEAPGGSAREVHARVRQAYAAQFGLEVGESLGFNNSYAIVVRGEDARRLRLRTISDAAAHTPGWIAGFGYEFLERPDGFAGLSEVYGLRFRSAPRIMDLGLLYKALKQRQVDLVAGNTTDGLIAVFDMVILEDDRGYFPPYEAVPIVRRDLLERHPEIRSALRELVGAISEEQMRRMNYALDGEHRDVKEVAREFLRGLRPTS